MEICPLCLNRVYEKVHDFDAPLCLRCRKELQMMNPKDRMEISTQVFQALQEREKSLRFDDFMARVAAAIEAHQPKDLDWYEQFGGN